MNRSSLSSCLSTLLLALLVATGSAANFATGGSHDSSLVNSGFAVGEIGEVGLEKKEDGNDIDSVFADAPGRGSSTGPIQAAAKAISRPHAPPSSLSKIRAPPAAH